MKAKKILVSTVAMSMALAIAIGGVALNNNVNSKAASVETASVLMEPSNVAGDLLNDKSYIEANNLFIERNAAFAQGDFEKCNTIDKKLSNLGYTEATEEEINECCGNREDNDDSTGCGCPGYSHDKNTRATVKQYTHKINNKTYVIRQTVLTPKNSKSSLTTFETVTKQNKNVVKAGSLGFLSAAATEIVSGVVSETMGKFITAYNIFKGTCKGMSKSTKIKNVKVNYSIDISETIMHLDVQSKAPSGKKFFNHGATYNIIDCDVDADTKGDIQVKNGYAQAKVESKNLHYTYRSRDYGNASKAVDAYKRGTEHINTVIFKAEIIGLNNKVLYTHFPVARGLVAGRGDMYEKPQPTKKPHPGVM